jgi:glycosyltransferase involved in cell wall biosynthesis
LTVDKANTAFAEKERDYDFEQLGIINHGFIPFEKVMEIYHQSKAIIYPSKNESLGLGLIEAIHYGCDVISSDLPYTYAVCEPSGVFDPVSPNSIADAIINYEKGKSPKSRLTIKDYINEIIELLQ